MSIRTPDAAPPVLTMELVIVVVVLRLTGFGEAVVVSTVKPGGPDAVPKVAVTERLAVIATVQAVAVPLQAPLQLVSVEPPAGVAVRVTLVPLAYVSAQSSPQSMPEGALVTVPAPARLTVSVKPPPPLCTVSVAALSTQT